MIRILVLIIFALALVWPSPVQHVESRKEAQRSAYPASGRSIGELPKLDVPRSKESHLPVSNADEIESIIRAVRAE